MSEKDSNLPERRTLLPAQRQDLTPARFSGGLPAKTAMVAGEVADIFSLPLRLTSYMFSKPRKEAFPTPRPGSQMRCPVVLLLDRSSSMSGSPMQELTEAIRRFKADILSEGHDIAALIDVAVVSFSSHSKVEKPFTPLSQFEVHELTPDGTTEMAEGIDTTLNLIEMQMQVYQSHRTVHTKPIICLITDGAPTDSPQRIEEMIGKIRSGDTADQGRFSFYAAGVSQADFPMLRRLSRRAPIELKGLDFRSLLSALAQEAVLQTQGRGREQLCLPAPVAGGS